MTGPCTDRANAARRARVTAQIEDLEFLLSVGTPVDLALARVGWTAGAAEKALYRRRHPLASVVGRLVRKERAA